VREGRHIRFWWERQKERDNYKVLDVGRRIILRWILKRWDGVVWTGLIWLRIGTTEKKNDIKIYFSLHNKELVCMIRHRFKHI
jgi:hypothetical protein